MKRSQVNDGWIRCNRSKTESGAAPEEMTGVVIKTSDVRKNWAFVPKWIVYHSDVMEHVFEDEEQKVIEYPVLNVEGVTKKSIEDCILLYHLSKKLIGSFGNQDFKWRYYSKNNTMQKVLRTVYRWRSRLGYLISTAGFFGWRLVQNLADAVMKYRVEHSYSKDLIFHLLSNGSDKYKNEKLLDFFVKKLQYERIHFDMLSVWITQKILNEWVYKLVFKSDDIESVNRNIPYLVENFKFKFLFWKYKTPAADLHGLFIKSRTRTVEAFKIKCDFIKLVCEHASLFDKRISFYNHYFLFKFIWQINQELFQTILQNIQKYKIQFEIVSQNIRSSYQEYFIQLFSSNRQCDFFPPTMVLERWSKLLNAMDAPDDTLDRILRFFPSHVMHCSELFLFRRAEFCPTGF
tara:strand:+ start:2250 stop:3461 length:1212 start_codon:yes stop_codon:yes gene_type:complete